MGGCERLMRSPIPLAYTHHTSRFLVFWAALLPVALFEDIGPAATALLSPAAMFLLFGVDEIAIELEEPFSVMDLEGMCATVGRDGEALLASAAGVGLLVKQAVEADSASDVGSSGGAAAEAAVGNVVAAARGPAGEGGIISAI